MASVYKKDSRRKNAPYYIAYNDEHGRRRVQEGCTDKSATERMARKLETDVELRRSGVVDSKADRHQASERRSLADHIDDFHSALSAKDNTPEHAGESGT